MDGVLSQKEINALLNNSDDVDVSAEETLTESEKDAIGEISNISMGTAATTLFSLVNRKVEISTPVVSFCSWDDIVAQYERPCVFIKIAYTVGLDGSNLLVLKENSNSLLPFFNIPFSNASASLASSISCETKNCKEL